MKMNIQEAILLQLENPLNEITARIIAEEKKQYLEKTGKELNLSPWLEKMIRLSLVIDLMKALQNYVLPTDELEEMKWNEGRKGIEIHASILREGVSHYFFTEAIYAGGYHIQRLHLRYLTKTKMTRLYRNELAKQYQDEYKKLTKIEKLEKEINDLQTRIENYQARIDFLTPMSKEELIVELANHPHLAWYAKREYTWEDMDENSYYKQNKSKEQWEEEQRQLIEDGVKNMIDWDVMWPKRHIIDYQKRITKLQSKIDLLK
jgi:hypothetical protein